MRAAWCSALLVVLGLTGRLVIAQVPASEVDTHVAAARAAAGMDFRNTFLNLCVPASGRGAAGAGRGTGQTPDRANWYAPPFKVFDNFYWLGTRQHSSWALQTSAGIIIIDTNFAWATEPEIVEGVTTLGLNPRDIKYVVISHAHGDHDQGAARVAETLRRQGGDGRGRLGRDAPASCDRRRGRANEGDCGRVVGLQIDAGRHDSRHRLNARSYTGDVVVCVPGEGTRARR